MIQAGQVGSRGGHAQDLREPLVGVDPAVHLIRIPAVALQAAVDAPDRLPEASAVHHRVVRGHGARSVLGHPVPQAGLPGHGRVCCCGRAGAATRTFAAGAAWRGLRSEHTQRSYTVTLRAGWRSARTSSPGPRQLSVLQDPLKGTPSPVVVAPPGSSARRATGAPPRSRGSDRTGARSTCLPRLAPTRLSRSAPGYTSAVYR